MKVRLKCTMAGVGFVWEDGTVIDITPLEALSLVEAGYAEAVTENEEPTPEIKNAMIDPGKVKIQQRGKRKPK